MKILIADAGASKTDWVKLTINNSSEAEEEHYTGIGISPLHHDTDMIEEELRLVRVALGESYDKIRFFGAGIGNPLIASRMETLLSEMFTCKDIKAEGDMLGAAIAVLGNQPGIACIMGTGSNSCHFDGASIDRKSVSLGYLLDDQGGGVAFCRHLLSDVYKNLAPEDIIQKFKAKYNLPVGEVVDHLYRQSSPNRWIASFMPFIKENITHPYINSLVESQVEEFFDREFSSYSEEELKEEGIGFVGSVADELSDILTKGLEKRNWKLRAIVRKPLSGIINQYK